MILSPSQCRVHVTPSPPTVPTHTIRQIDKSGRDSQVSLVANVRECKSSLSSGLISCRTPSVLVPRPMRLVNTTSYELREFPSNIPPYAILSHRWENDEVTFADLKGRHQPVENSGQVAWTPNSDNMKAKERSWWKLENACKCAREKGYIWLWLDTCCIDKTSSSELQEAMNSMFTWYRDAGICLAYLNDVPDPATDDPQRNGSKFRRSVWFTRGWTLQELIAPNTSMVFLSKDWIYLGCRDDLATIIAEITNVDVSLLSAQSLASSQERLNFSNWSVATRMSWAANRETTRAEDGAYSLVGLFNVSMPILYGEGGEQAFWRLQLEIIRQSPDQSVFAWDTRIRLRHVPFTSFWGPSSPLGGYNFEFRNIHRPPQPACFPSHRLLRLF